MEKSIHAPKNWQPEHMPIGSVIRYTTYSGGQESAVKEVTVTGLAYNGVDSFVFETDDQCPIFHDDPSAKASANGAHVVEIVSRGNGGCNFHRKAQAERVEHRTEYVKRLQRGLIHGQKGSQHYVAFDHWGIVMMAITSNDKLFGLYSNPNHHYNFSEEFYLKLADCFEWVGEYRLVVRANKRKLIKRLKRVLPHHRVSKAFLLKKERAVEEEFYRKDMADLDNYYY